jgi:hypothetical protein
VTITPQMREYLRLVRQMHMEDDEHDYAKDDRKDCLFLVMTQEEQDATNDIVLAVFGDILGIEE